jgi:hypothetical protein
MTAETADPLSVDSIDLSIIQVEARVDHGEFETWSGRHPPGPLMATSGNGLPDRPPAQLVFYVVERVRTRYHRFMMKTMLHIVHGIVDRTSVYE